MRAVVDGASFPWCRRLELHCPGIALLPPAASVSGQTQAPLETPWKVHFDRCVQWFLDRKGAGVSSQGLSGVSLLSSERWQIPTQRERAQGCRAGTVASLSTTGELHNSQWARSGCPRPPESLPGPAGSPSWPSFDRLGKNNPCKTEPIQALTVGRCVGGPLPRFEPTGKQGQLQC